MRGGTCVRARGYERAALPHRCARVALPLSRSLPPPPPCPAPPPRRRYPSDDINKFLWMVRIGGGEFGDIKEADFVSDKGYTVDSHATPAMLASTMYRLSYYRFAAATARGPNGEGGGMDRVRGAEIGLKDFSLRYFEEVFTSQHWMMRVYRVKEDPEREARLPNPRRRAGAASKA